MMFAGCHVNKNVDFRLRVLGLRFSERWSETCDSRDPRDIKKIFSKHDTGVQLQFRNCRVRAKLLFFRPVLAPPT